MATVAPEPVAAPDDRDPWQRFEDEREAILGALGEPILDCVQRNDTEHAAFHGCYDWHSAVHGVWALYAIGRLDGNASWAAAANAQLSYTSIDAVRAEIESGALDREIPYGFSWFLLLSIERERTTGSNDMRSVAALAAKKLRAHVESLGVEAKRRGLQSDDYRNLSWAVLNLWRWARFSGDQETQAWVESFARDHLLEMDGTCSLRTEAYADDNFFPPCLLRVHAITNILSPDEGRGWLEQFVGRDATIAPLTKIEKAHPGGLNFSRAWGLWSLWQSTGEPEWRDAYVDHVVTHVEQPQYWREGYRDFSHWVPQFGVYAIGLSFEGQ